jgi:phage terminase large subunit GpA-like protein
MIALQQQTPSDFDLPRDAWLTPKPMNPAEWTERNIYLDSRTTSTPGFYNLDQFPYCRAVFDAILNKRVEKIILDWATQTGKSTWAMSILGWIAENAPGPAMIGVANEAAAKAHYKRLLEPSLERVEAIRRRMPSKTRRRWQIVDLGNMLVFYAWPGSPATVSDRPIKYLLVNEASLWPGAKGSEGDPVQMAFDRTKAFPHPGRKIIIEGKPTIEGECRLTTMLDASRKHVLHVPCPKCGEYQPLVKGKPDIPGGIKWDEDYDTPGAAEQASATAHWECCACQSKHTEEVKPTALARSVWCPDGQTVEKNGKLVGKPLRNEREMGFHLNSLYSTVVTWGDFALTWVKNRESPGKLQAVVNGWLAETWKRKKRKVGNSEVEAHLSAYKMGSVPIPCIALAMTVDVQESEFWYTIRAWSWLANSALVTRGIVQTWEQLDEVREKTWPGTGGELHNIFLTLIDSADGTRTNEIYEWCAARANCIPIRGAHQYQQLSMVREATVMPQDIPIWHIDAGRIRDQLYDVRLRKRNDEPGSWLLPEDVGADYLRGLAAWERRDKKIGDELKKRWYSNSPSYEHAADCELMQEAFAFIYRLAEKRPPEPKPAPVRVEGGSDQRAWIATHR